MFAPQIRGADDDPVREWFFARYRKEAVDVALLQLVVRGVELALDGVVFASSGSLDHQINARVPLVQPLQLCPLGIRPHIAVKVAVGGLIAQVANNQLFKVGAFFALGCGCAAVGVE